MRFERLSNDQFTIFLPFDDLVDRGFTTKDIWEDASSVRNLFSDMMHEASSELGVELEGMLFVQVHLMQAQGMHVTVTQKFEDINWDDEYVEMKVTLDESKEIIFSFEEFEHIIQVVAYLSSIGLVGGKVYHLDDRYYMLFKEEDIKSQSREDIIAVLSEFAYPSIITSHRLNEYGVKIYTDQAVTQIMSVFLKS
ncbi:genetic competence negative regulator [Oceanobacillus halophilus]|uniref:Genetic competence negative regulator n=1 Tax=Oceanobacillus halophilus TaxID=930130 RepID=A0A495ACJ6_9BACI|nr:genetic competence negative regulator [Oceanobacillus halophilus]RKQ37686.1 genetic competence negative regulator [Oceanobacillus halophilus]